MVQWHTESTRKSTGGLRRSVRARDKKLSERGGIISETKLGASEKRMTTKALGNNLKVKLLLSKQANVVDDKGRIVRAEIVTVKGNDANKLFVRRNIMTKGAVIEVVLGADHRLAKVTNRPGQTGEIDAIVLPVDAIKQYTKERATKEHKTAQTGETKQNTAKEAEKTKN